jgi:hypothetical protein
MNSLNLLNSFSQSNGDSHNAPPRYLFLHGTSINFWRQAIVGEGSGSTIPRSYPIRTSRRHTPPGLPGNRLAARIHVSSPLRGDLALPRIDLYDGVRWDQFSALTRILDSAFVNKQARNPAASCRIARCCVSATHFRLHCVVARPELLFEVVTRGQAPRGP